MIPSDCCKSALRRRARGRAGSMLLLGTLAAAMLSLGSIAIVKSHSRQIAMTQAEEASVEGRLTAQGLLHRSTSTLKVNPVFSGTVIDSDASIPSAFAKITLLDPSKTQIEVYLYPSATVPAIVRVVDPATL